MKIASNVNHLLPNLNPNKDSRTEKPAIQEGRLELQRPVTDLLEISPEARKLADDAIIHHPIRKYDSLPDKPVGAPDDYIKAEDLMKRFEPETYRRFQDTVQRNAAEGLSILLKFARQIPEHPEWLRIYREELAASRN